MIKDNLKLFDRSRDNIWIDKYVSKNMLAAHLDENSDAASRNIRTLERTIQWIKGFLPKGSRILDLGCGPGLYSYILALEGYIVHGIDYSEDSIRSVLEKQFFSVAEFKSDLVEQNSFTSNSVMFIKCRKHLV